MLELGNQVICRTVQLQELGLGTVLDVRGNQAKVEFRPSVFSKPPHITETRILELIRT